MFMKKMAISVLIICAILFMGAEGSFSADKPIILTYSSSYGETFSLSMHDKWWAKEVEKRTNGRVKIEFYWQEALAKIPEALDAANSGLADISFFNSNMFGANLPLSQVSTLLYMSQKPDAVSNAMMDLYKNFEPLRVEYEKKNNVRILSFSATTPCIVGTRTPWKNLEAFKGKKIRTAPGLEGPLAAVGATPVTIAWGEIYTSLERGVIDAYSGTMWDLAGIGKFHEKAPYILDLGIGVYGLSGTHINKGVWNKLPDDIKKILADVAVEAVQKQAGLYMEADKRIYDVYKKAGVKTVTFSKEDKDKFRSHSVPKLWDKWIATMEGKGLPGKKCVEEYQKAINKYESKSPYVSPFDRFKDLAM